VAGTAEPRPITRILAIRFARLGDVILVFPALARLREAYPGARITLMTGLPCAPAARLCPFVDETLAVDRLGMRDGPRLRAAGDIVRLIGEVRRGDFDLVVDFHSFRETNLLAWFSGAPLRLGLQRSDRAYLSFCFNIPPVPEDKSCHLAEMFMRVSDGAARIRRPDAPEGDVGAFGPTIHVPDDLLARVRARHLEGLADPGLLVAVYVGASVSSRRWPRGRFAAVARHLLSESGAGVAILTGASPAEEQIGQEIAAAVNHPGRVRLLTELGIPELAAVIGSSRLLVSNDTGPMHIGPALGVPTLGIFSESEPRHYRPLGPADRYVRKPRIDDVTVEEVIETIEEMRAMG
jgi:ADP-heptose:LPS heptosyltransferase